jgi:hypothetical protein
VPTLALLLVSPWLDCGCARAHTHSPLGQGQEDPFIWADARGNFHMLSHGSTNAWFTTPDSLGSWTTASGPAYPPYSLTWVNGTEATLHRRERPQVGVRFCVCVCVWLSCFFRRLGVTSGRDARVNGRM